MTPAAIAEVISQLDVTEQARLAVALAFASALRAESGDFDRQRFLIDATDAIDWQDPTADPSAIAFDAETGR